MVIEIRETVLLAGPHIVSAVVQADIFVYCLLFIRGGATRSWPVAWLERYSAVCTRRRRRSHSPSAQQQQSDTTSSLALRSVRCLPVWCVIMSYVWFLGF